MAEMQILTYDGKNKTIKGQQRALLFRTNVKSSFDHFAKQHPGLSFWKLCEKVGQHLNCNPTRVIQIVKHDYEYQE